MYKSKTGSHQHGFMKGKNLYQTSEITFYDEIIGSVDEGKAVAVVYCCFR